MMNDIFNNSSTPFYKFGDVKFLKKIAADQWESFISEGFQKTGKEIGTDFVNRIIASMQRHSWYIQQFSYFVWVATTKKVTIEIFLGAMQKLIESNAPFFMNVCENLSAKQINLIKAVSMKVEQITSASVMKKYDLGTSGTVIKNRNVLVEKDIFDSNNGVLTIQDPVFEIWFRKVYFNEDYLK
jgi:hypothetical protein